MSRPVLRVWAKLLILTTFISGCAPTQPFFLHEDGDLSHYLDIATDIEYPDVEEPRLADAEQTIDPLTISPLDTETIFASVRKTGRLVIVHEDTLTGGWGAEVAAQVADKCLFYLEAPIKRIATYDTPLPAAPILEEAVLPTTSQIRSTILDLLGYS